MPTPYYSILPIQGSRERYVNTLIIRIKTFVHYNLTKYHNLVINLNQDIISIINPVLETEWEVISYFSMWSDRLELSYHLWQIGEYLISFNLFSHPSRESF